MNEREIFKRLFEVAETGSDPEGVVVAGLVQDGKLILSCASADDGIRHAEDLLLEKARKQGIQIIDRTILYTTLEPCGYRTPKNNVEDCTTLIIDSGVKKVVFAAEDVEWGKGTRGRLNSAGVNIRQVEDKKITQESIEIFNATSEIPLGKKKRPL